MFHTSSGTTMNRMKRKSKQKCQMRKYFNQDLIEVGFTYFPTPLPHNGRSTSTSAHALSSRSLKTIDSESSDASESSYEDKSEAEYVLNEWFACSVGALISNSGEESSGSTGEEDWSNNISYIVRIP